MPARSCATSSQSDNSSVRNIVSSNVVTRQREVELYYSTRIAEMGVREPQAPSLSIPKTISKLLTEIWRARGQTKPNQTGHPAAGKLARGEYRYCCSCCLLCITAKKRRGGRKEGAGKHLGHSTIDRACPKRMIKFWVPCMFGHVVT